MALIITIIVMIILSGVIITVVVSDKGIINKAESSRQENERAMIEEIVVASYVFKENGILNMDRTAEAIFENLTANEFTLMNGEEKVNYASDILRGSKIYLDIIGKYGRYKGIVNKTGIESNLENVIPGDTTNKEEEKSEYFNIEYNNETKTAKVTGFSSKGLEKYNSGITEFEIPNTINGADENDYTITEIGGFTGMNRITSMKLPNTIAKINDYTFESCTNLRLTVLPEELVTIGSGAFSNSGVEITKIPNKVNYIGMVAFSNCINLTQIEIPKTVTTIGSVAFAGCTNLTNIYCPGNTTQPSGWANNWYGMPGDSYKVIWNQELN